MSPDLPRLELRGVACSRPAAYLRDVNISFFPGYVNALVGDLESALLLLRVASLQEAPDAGEVLLEQRPVASGAATEREQLRGRHFGFLYSAPYVLPGLSVVENVAMPLLRVLGIETADASRKTAGVLDFVGLGERLGDEAGELSRLEQHRLALARAVVHDPHFLVLDRAETSLAPDEAALFRQLVHRACTERKLTVLAVGSAAQAHAYTGIERILSVRDGVVSEVNAPAHL